MARKWWWDGGRRGKGGREVRREKGEEEECKRVQVLGERKKKGVKRSVGPVLKGGN